MSRVYEEIVREYFEGNGFLVRQLRKYQVQSRKKTTDEEIDLLVFNPRFHPGERKPGFLLFSSELPFLHRAVVVVKGWHTSRLTPGILKSSTKLFRFLEQAVAKRAAGQLPEGEGVESMENHLKILVLPGFPTMEPFRSQSIELLRSRGVDGIISFRSMLLEIVGRVEINHNYEKSDLLEMIRLLKNYELIKDPQLELFGGNS
ncbi:MAG: hypothetical protein WD490_02815 [Opitutales bacterium]